MIKIDTAELRILVPTKNPFLSLASSIIYQQISTKAGDSIYKRFIGLFGRKKPSPKLLLSLRDQELRTAGLSVQKMGYIRDLAEKFLDGTIDLKQIPSMSDIEVKEHLVTVKGIGPWTADMFLIFALNRPNILPLGDLGIRKGFQKAFSLKTLPSQKTMRRLAKPYEGKYTELSLHLWHILEKS